jgi:antitoxin component HigA of HigAB toxin-antitoxin module
MAWRVTVDGFPPEVKDAKQAVAYLEKVLTEDPETGKLTEDWFDHKEKPAWHIQAPEFCNGIHHFGQAWEQGRETIMIRFMGDFPQAIRAFNRAGLKATEGG